jgi:hypothetical protein
MTLNIKRTHSISRTKIIYFVISFLKGDKEFIPAVVGRLFPQISVSERKTDSTAVILPVQHIVIFVFGEFCDIFSYTV